MRTYTKRGDAGMTTLHSATQISKADERIGALGALEELSAQIALAMVAGREQALLSELARVRRVLATVADGIAEPRNRSFLLPAEELTYLEERIGEVNRLLSEQTGEGEKRPTELSARLELACAVARRTESFLIATDRKYAISAATKAYMNRLSDYLGARAELAQTGSMPTVACATPTTLPEGGNDAMRAIVDQVLQHVGAARPMDLKRATRLIEAVEAAATAAGKQAVIAVCNAEGNPVAVHVMDGAFLVSYDVAIKKAYTAVAVKMATRDLAPLVQPGQTFYGLQNVDKMVVFGGGVPLKVGDVIVGGLGVSGGTGEEDHALCEAGLAAFAQL